MDPNKSQNCGFGRLREMKRYKKTNQLLYNLCRYIAIAFTCSMLCYSPTWLPRMVNFFFITIPSLKNEVVNPKFMFVVVNVIVVILVGESKLGGSNASSDTIYDEYIERKRSLKGEYNNDLLEKEQLEDKETLELVDHVVIGERENDGADEKKEEVVNNEKEKPAAAITEAAAEEKGEEEEDGDDDDDGEDGDALPADELNKRVEEFIARVNRRRWIEARSLILGRG